MNRIADLANHVVATGYLDLQTENRLRTLLQEDYGLEDFKAFMNLQWAVMDGVVTQESLELHKQSMIEDDGSSAP